MPIAAVPQYLGNDFSQASPGMRFTFYLPIRDNDNPKDTLNTIVKLNPSDTALMTQLLSRQSALASVLESTDQLLTFDALTVAPFTTGLGNEHPLENGFAFLTPYGLPYLPGSGVKGVLRQAARELSEGQWGETYGWDQQALTALFGLESKESDTNHQRGVLSFWDVIPQIQGQQLDVEIMTPHQKHYYQEGMSPHEAANPIPISYLSVPPNSRFVFHIQCNLLQLAHLAPELVNDHRWKVLLQAALNHAYEWCGFGAKTALGYGAMQINPAWQKEQERIHHERQLQQQQLDHRQQLLDAGIAEDAIELKQWLENDSNLTNNSIILEYLNHYLKDNPSPSDNALEILRNSAEQYWPNILANPKATKGKKKKPKFNPGPIALAEKINALIKTNKQKNQS